VVESAELVDTITARCLFCCMFKFEVQTAKDAETATVIMKQGKMMAVNFGS